MEETLGQAIRRMRIERGISQTYIARALKYKSVSPYNAFEMGRKKSVTFEQLKMIADILQVDINEFIFGQNLRETRITNVVYPKEESV